MGASQITYRTFQATKKIKLNPQGGCDLCAKGFIEVWCRQGQYAFALRIEHPL